ncbi:MAG: tRNA (adenosine(37)-N6)-threonylcarbamoyltransferase complex dimerization subunit type 1 TsaB [bacterium]|nr:tRNA (adenosine(37)-N6)-threonylcarbamoyltransferase complex dimerization subunit type 1 TsaB [bacterium]
MNILGIETSAGHCSIGFTGDGNETLEETDSRKNSFTESVFRLIGDVLKRSGVDKKDIDGIAVCTGPGSFTGVRVGLSTAKGLAYSMEVPLIGISTFEVLAHQVPQEYYPLCCVVPYKKDKISYSIFTGNDMKSRPDIREGVWDDLIDLRTGFCSVSALVDESRTSLLKNLVDDESRIFANAPTGSAAAEVGLKKLKAGIIDDLADIEPVYMHALKFQKKESFDPGK